MQVAQTIMSQIGGIDNMYQITEMVKSIEIAPRYCVKRIIDVKWIIIMLDENDTYTVHIAKKYKKAIVLSGVYAEDLRGIIQKYMD